MKLITMKQFLSLLFFIWATYVTYMLISLGQTADAVTMSNAYVNYNNCFMYSGSNITNSSYITEVKYSGYNDGSSSSLQDWTEGNMWYRKQVVSASTNMRNDYFYNRRGDYVRVYSFFSLDRNGTNVRGANQKYTACSNGSVMVGATLRYTNAPSGVDLGTLGIDILCCKLNK